MIERYQQQIGEWQTAVIPTELNTPRHHFNRSLEEMKELHDAVLLDNGSPETRNAVHEEAADVMIRMIGLIVSAGGNVSEVLDRKIQTMQEKYPPEKIQGQLKAGVPFDLAMATQKSRWLNPKVLRLNKHE